MFVRRGFVGTNPNAPRVPIPKPCYDARTIYLNELDILTIFKDRRDFAQKYVEEVLPQLALQVQKDKLLHVYKNLPDNGYFEFDYGTKVLSYCSLEKK